MMLSVNMNMKQFLTIVFCSLVVSSISLPIQQSLASPAPEECSTALEIVLSMPETFSTLEALILAASPADPGFYADLSNPTAAFTVFAPTNDAFEELLELFQLTPEAALATSPEELDTILKYHVLPGVALSSSDITEGDVLDTVLGAPLVADLPVIKSTSDEVEVVQADVVACGGIIHVIDGVLLPITEEELDILEGAPEEETPEEDLPIGPGCSTPLALAFGLDDFAILEALVTFVFELDPSFYALINDPTAELTILAPVNSAFENLLDTLGIRLGQFIQNESNKALVDALLKYHIIPSANTLEMLASGATVVTSLGSELSLDLPVIEGAFSNATVTSGDVIACASFIQVLDSVLLPVDPEDL